MRTPEEEPARRRPHLGCLIWMFVIACPIPFGPWWLTAICLALLVLMACFAMREMNSGPP